MISISSKFRILSHTLETRYHAVRSVNVDKFFKNFSHVLEQVV
ncbi:hypothetical protein ACQRDX_08635 [Streptococcus sp. SGI.013]